ncbi:MULTISPECIES: hypothetical protein [unclassified Paenibacillus]|uniref:hypothetical protein n=1 Tax=unclassified Paenibacillus TaxID=185978 RepID=UPI002F3EA519
MLRKLMMASGTALFLLVAAACGSSTTGEEAEPSATVPAAEESNPSTEQPKVDKTSKNITQVEANIKFQLDKPEFKQLLDIMQPGPVIPGLELDLVPQGLDYIKEKDWFIVSHYRAAGGASVLSLLDADSGDMVKYFHLNKEDGSVYAGHAGGVAVSKQHAWVSSDKHLYQIKLEDIYNGDSNAKLKFSDRIETDTRASFNAYADGVLWVGEFAHGLDYPTNIEHRLMNRAGEEYNAWIMGYKLDEETDTLPQERLDQRPARPDYILSVADRMQGVELLEDQIILSQSFGRNNSSELHFHENVLLEKPHQHVTIDGVEVPVWFLDKENMIQKLEGPPMSESAIVKDQTLYVLFESAADNYRDSGSYPLDRIQYVELDKLPAK